MSLKTEKKCGFPECGRPYFSRGLCSSHSYQQKRNIPLTPIGVLKKRPIKDGKYQCKRCAEYKEPEMFGIYTNSSDGRKRVCRKCVCKQSKSIYENPNKYKQRLAFMIIGARQRALGIGSVRNSKRKRKLEFTLENGWAAEQYERQNGLCYYTGLPMTNIHGKGRIWSNTSLDRVDPTKGYTPENCVLCCCAVNELKGDRDLATIIRICAAFLAHTKV